MIVYNDYNWIYIYENDGVGCDVCWLIDLGQQMSQTLY